MKPGVKAGLLVVGLFSLLGCAWTALFYAAGRARVETVPLVAPTANANPEAR